MLIQITPKIYVQLLTKIFIGLLVIGSMQSANAQIDCNHLTLEFAADDSFYGFKIVNSAFEETDWIIEIIGADYTLDGSLFSNDQGILLTVTSTQNPDGTYNHILTPDQPIGSYEGLKFEYKGVPYGPSGNFRVNAQLKCSFVFLPLCPDLKFNFFNQSQFSFGFSVQNTSDTPCYPYEIHIDNANYKLDLSQLVYDGFDLFFTDNGNGTIDYYFIAQDTIDAYGSSPMVRTTQNLGPGVTSDGATIRCSDHIVSSGNNGGLESHGALASKIALRSFKRALGKDTAPLVARNNNLVKQLVPEHILIGDKRVESSPSDLVEITTAESIWAGDYYINDNRFASIFGSKTSEEVYDHTKVICDRVKGSELAAVEVVNIDGYETILSVIRRPSGAVEYAISFSLAYSTFGEFTMASNWAIDEYQSSPNFLNYQVWTNSKAKSVAAVQHIISNIISENGYNLYKAAESPRAPMLFARRAHYKLGAFYIELNNRLTEATTVHFSGTCNTKEVEGEAISFSEEMEVIPGQTSLKLEIPAGNIFDGEISIKTADNQKDLIYLADGSWGIEYLDHSTTVETYEIIADERTEQEKEYLVERGISVSGTTDSYISIFKQLIPGGLAVDLSEYNTLSFDSKREGVYEVTLLTADNTDPSQNLSFTLKAGAASTVNIPYVLFSNGAGGQLDASKITTIYIAFTAANNERNDFDFTIENVRFINDEDANLNIDPTKLNVYPNPSDGIVHLTHVFHEATDVQITVCNANGVVVEEINTSANAGLNNFELQLDNSEQGMFLISLNTDKGVYTNTLLMMR